MDRDSLYLIFNFLKVKEKINFGLTCRLWYEIFSDWFDTRTSALVILHKRHYLDVEDINKLSRLSKKHYEISKILFKINHNIKAKWRRTHRCLEKHPKSKKQSPTEINSFCYLISELGFGVWVDNSNRIESQLKIVSVWGQELQINIEGSQTITRHFYLTCCYFHRTLEQNELILHTMNKSMKIFTIRINVSNLKNITAKLVESNCCQTIVQNLDKVVFHMEHYYHNQGTTVICQYSRQYTTTLVKTPTKQYNVISLFPSKLITFVGPYLVLFVNNSVKIYDMVNDFVEFTTNDNYRPYDYFDILHLKYYPDANVIYVFCKLSSVSAKLILDIEKRIFRIETLGFLELKYNFYEHNKVTNQLETISMRNFSKQFYYGSACDNGYFKAFN
jgi:hypothetical protein